ADASADLALDVLHDELAALPCPAGSSRPPEPNGVAVPLRVWTPDRSRLLSLISTTTVFGTAIDVALAELTMECFYPADQSTREAFQNLGD
ncbi:MAG: transcriptional regulator, partial [Sphingomonas sp.]